MAANCALLLPASDNHWLTIGERPQGLAWQIINPSHLLIEEHTLILSGEKSRAEQRLSEPRFTPALHARVTPVGIPPSR